MGIDNTLVLRATPDETDPSQDKVQVVYRSTGHPVKWRSDCITCLAYAAGPSEAQVKMFPDHDAMSGCRSGGRNHCTCDGCF